MANAPAAPLDVGRLRLLREVALRGTIAGAARACGLTASAVSQQLAVLAREAGTPLFDRTPRGVVLTGAGQLLAERAAEVLELLAATRSDLDRLRGEVAGEVTVAAVASAAAALVSPALTGLRASDPRVVVSVVVAEPSRSLELVLADDADLAVVDEYDYVPLALPEPLTATDLVSEPLVVLAAPGVLRGRADVALADLAELDWVMPPDEAACGHAVRSACRAAGFEPAVRWETDDMLLLVRAVAARHGVAVLPRLAVAADAAQVSVRPLREPSLRRRLLAVSRPSAKARPIVGLVLAALTAASSPER
ncbi:MAG: LysR family transcriptional regulator [Actinomycetia bacterium]|nr:LysR family transcriptional regulator [Actinomycetes bacterium]